MDVSLSAGFALLSLLSAAATSTRGKVWGEGGEGGRRMAENWRGLSRLNSQRRGFDLKVLSRPASQLEQFLIASKMDGARQRCVASPRCGAHSLLPLDLKRRPFQFQIRSLHAVPPVAVSPGACGGAQSSGADETSAARERSLPGRIQLPAPVEVCPIVLKDLQFRSRTRGAVLVVEKRHSLQ